MADRKKRSNKNHKQALIIVSCLVVLILVITGIMISKGDSQSANAPQYSKIDTTESIESNASEPSINEPSTDEAATNNKKEEPTEEESTSVKSEPSEPVTVKPTNSGSFYDSVKYRSPDAVTADIFKHGRNLMLLNRQYELPENFQWDLVYWSNGNSVDAMYLNCEEHNSVKAVDRAAYQPLKNMFADAESAGVPLQLVSAYRSIYLQDKLFTRSVNSYISQGYSETDAINKANYSRTFSGTSEHNTGLGFDILQKGNFTLSTSFEDTAQFKWLMENAENYGFILRYNKDKVNETGIMYEPWHFRYVGVEHAKKINELGMCLEEYIDYLEA